MGEQEKPRNPGNKNERRKKLRQRAAGAVHRAAVSPSHLVFILPYYSTWAGLVQEGRAGYTKRRIVARKSKPSLSSLFVASSAQANGSGVGL